ncbi:MAG: hypothetical protein AAF939_20790 [Planctomycetota bacterium]
MFKGYFDLGLTPNGYILPPLRGYWPVMLKGYYGLGLTPEGYILPPLCG